MIPSIRPYLFFARLLISGEIFSRPTRRLLIAVRTPISDVFNLQHIHPKVGQHPRRHRPRH
jgi:hypothetical protein